MDLKKLMKESGIVGAGGAGFPSYAKLADGADTLVVNGAECEPLLYTDYVLMGREMPLILAGIREVMAYCHIPRALLCIKKHTAERLSFQDGATLDKGIFVKILPDVYPIGDEISLIYQATGRIVRPGNLPITSAVIVDNVETMYNLGRAVRYGERVWEKWITVGGDVERHAVIRVPVGTRVGDVLSALGITVPSTHSVIDGGPSMGRLINPNTAVVTKTTKAINILPTETRAIETKRLNPRLAITRAETACCQCTRCTDLCPRALLGYPLEPHKMVRTAMGAVKVEPSLVISATLCCGCGICESLACSQGISPKAVISEYKALLAKNKMKYIATEDVEVTEEREYRMIPSEKWASMLGVRKYDKVPEYLGPMEFDRVEIPLGRIIGAPAVPVVYDGQVVARGDIVAKYGEGLSVSIAASIDGVVSVERDFIRIDKKR